MNKKSLVFFFLFITLIIPSLNFENWTIYNNSITINSIKSNLTREQRDDYYYWIGLRNSFYYSQDSNQLEKLVKYFSPEDPEYYSNLHSFTIPSIIIACSILVITIIYLITRFFFHGCQGPKAVDKSYYYITYVIIGFGFVWGLVFLILMLYNSSKSE